MTKATHKKRLRGKEKRSFAFFFFNSKSSFFLFVQVAFVVQLQTLYVLLYCLH
ncbi:unnamed protein product, partial [Sphagnum jensenii]